MKIKADYTNAPQWRELSVKSSLPEELKCLDEIAHNLWWVWNFEARDLFRDLDPTIYHDVKHNPVMLLERLTFSGKEEVLNEGDSIYFNPTYPHGQRCNGDVPATFLTMIAE